MSRPAIFDRCCKLRLNAEGLREGRPLRVWIHLQAVFPGPIRTEVVLRLKRQNS